MQSQPSKSRRSQRRPTSSVEVTAQPVHAPTKDMTGEQSSADAAELNSQGSSAESKPTEGRLDPWSLLLEAVEDGDEQGAKKAIAAEVVRLIELGKESLKNYLLLALWDPFRSISLVHANQLYRDLTEHNQGRAKDVMLLLVSDGGYAESAYQISKLCKAFAREKFVVTVPSRAKSAATLLALGADEIHMGLLGELGPIDTQVGGIPMLAVRDALRTVAALAEEFPKSASMFAQYLQGVLSVPQIGYSERIGESTSQYAERLLASKTNLPRSSSDLAHWLVHGYLNHNFVIDVHEARQLLGEGLVKEQSVELAFSEAVYRRIDLMAFVVKSRLNFNFSLVGVLGDPDSAWLTQPVAET